jgi:hypothetical protein
MNPDKDIKHLGTWQVALDAREQKRFVRLWNEMQEEITEAFLVAKQDQGFPEVQSLLNKIKGR